IPGVSRVAMRPKLQVTPVCPSAGIGSEWAQRGGNGVATMSLSYEEAYAQVTGPGQIFELVEDAIDGVSYRVFKNAPPTLGQLLAGARGAESTFIVYEDERWTFDETMRSVEALAHALVNRFGIKKGYRVGISMRNLPEWVVSFAAILSIGAVSVSLNAWWTESEVDYAIEDSGISLLITDPERIDRSHRSAHSRGLPMIVVRADEIEPQPTGVRRFGEVITVSY